MRIKIDAYRLTTLSPSLSGVVACVDAFGIYCFALKLIILDHYGKAHFHMPDNVPITVAHGDGIGPEIMQATLHILQAAGARIEIETIDIGEKVYLAGNSAGIEPSAWESLRRTQVFLKAPITTPQGGGYKSLNVTTRKT